MNWGRIIPCLLLLLPLSLSAEKIQIRFWTYPRWTGMDGTEKNGKPDDWPRLKIREFQQKHPEVEVKLELLTWEGGAQKLNLAVLARRPPDICMAQEFDKFADQGVLEPLDDWLTAEAREDISPNVFDLCRHRGQLCLWPWYANPLALFLNEEIFKERHVERLIPPLPSRAWTYDEFLAAAKATTFDRDGDGRVDVWGTCLHGRPLTLEYRMFPFVLGFGGRIYDDAGKRFMLNSPEGVRGFQFLVDLMDTHKVAPANAGGLNVKDEGGMFSNGEVAMIVSTSMTLKNTRFTSGKGRVLAAQPPQVEGRPPSTMFSVGGYVVFRQKDETKRRLVMEFTRHLTDTDSCRALKVIANLPARRSAMDGYRDDPEMGVLIGLMPDATVYFKNRSPEMTPVINNLFVNVLTRRKTPAAALAGAEKQSAKVQANESP